MKKGLVVFLAAFFVVASCSKSGSDGGSGGSGTGGGAGGGSSVNCSGVPSAFGANVKPIIQSTCATDATCHGAGSANGPGPLQTYDQIFNARVIIRSAVSSGSMPKTGTLTTVQKNTILCWIDSGAPNN
ncbi:MAG TPA: hypothetical protein VFU29_15320 [Chitinophagaceae bacterium]|nr:hypothetical protein [Chitinophagaceae bacterium]